MASLGLLALVLSSCDKPDPVVSEVRAPLATSAFSPLGNYGRVVQEASTDIYGLIEAATLSSARFVTAGKLGTGSTGALKVALWRQEDDQTTTLLSELETPQSISTQVSVARADDRHFVVATRDENGKLELIAFAITSGDTIEKTDSQERSGVGGTVSITSLNASPSNFPFDPDLGQAGESHVVVAYRGAGGNLGLYDYSIDGDGKLRANGGSSAGPVPGVSVAYVPGSQPPAAWYSRTTDSAERTAAACQDGVDDDGDHYVDCDDWDCCGNSVCDGVGSCVQGTVVTANYNNASSDRLISWRVTAQGNMSRLKDGFTGPGSTIAVSPQSFRRIATVRLNGSTPVVETWDVSPEGGFGAVAALNLPGTSVGARIVNGGGGRLFVQATTTNSLVPGQLFSIDATGGRLSSGTNDQASQGDSPGSLVSLSQDRAIMVYQRPASDLPSTTCSLLGLSCASTLVVASYRDFHQPMLRGTYTLSSSSAATPQNNTETFNIIPSSTGQTELTLSADSGIAVGDKYVLACTTGAFVIYDKAGNALSPQIGTSQLFAPLTRATVAGSVNQQRLGRHLPFQYLCDGSREASTTAGAENGCLDSGYAFDTKCTFDEKTQRFVITSMLRFGSSLPLKDRLQRHVAIAVSNQTDPRKGFSLFTTTDNKYDDNPMIAANDGQLVVVHQSDSEETYDAYRENLAPSALVFNLDDMAANATTIRNTKVAPWQTSGVALKVANSRGDYQPNVVYRSTIANSGSPAYRLIFFKMVGPGPVDAQQPAAKLELDPATYGGTDATPAWLQLDASSAGNYAGHFYLVDRYQSGDLARVRVSSASVSATANTTTSALQTVDLATAGSADVLGCDSEHDCRLPAMAVVAPKGRATGSGSVYAIYARYDTRYVACPADVSCSTGVCIGRSCQTTVYNPGVFYTRFDESLNRFGTKPFTLARGARLPDLAELSPKKWTLGHAGAMADLSNQSVWFIDTIPSASSWQFVVGQAK